MKTTQRFEIHFSQLRKQQDGFCDYSRIISSFNNLDDAIEFVDDLSNKGIYGEFKPNDDFDYCLDIVDANDTDNIVYQTSIKSNFNF